MEGFNAAIDRAHAFREAGADVGFVEAMIAKEAADHNVDRKRVFSAGWSNGGQLGYRFALERANQFAAVAAISANLPKPGNLACTPSGASMPVMVINGTDDPINPFGGGDVIPIMPGSRFRIFDN